MPISNKPIKSETEVLGKRMYVFGKEYASDFDPQHKIPGAGMVIDINGKTTFIPCEVPVELDYNAWSLLKNIGRIPRIVGVQKTNETKK